MVIVLSFICALVLAFCMPGWHEETDGTGSVREVKPFPSRPMIELTRSCAFISTMLCLVAVLWQHVGAVGAAAMVESTGYGNIKTTIGTSAMVMGWCSAVLILLVTVLLSVLIWSIKLLDEITDEPTINFDEATNTSEIR